MRYFLKGLKFAAIMAVIATALSFVVMLLWNWLMPSLFSWHVITFWQAAGILVLSKILLGGFWRGPGAALMRKHCLVQNWDTMTPEEKERFRKGLQTCCPPRDSDKAGEKGGP